MLKDPLIHFLLLGGLLFLFYDWRGEPEGAGPYQILISAGEVQSITQTLTILNGRDPTRDEVLETLEPSIMDEILYREALALGLDEDDSQVRLRLAEKMLFLTQDIAEPVPPTDEEAAEFFAADPERFRTPELLTFEQIFYSPAEHGQNIEDVATEALVELRAGVEPTIAGDNLLFEDVYSQVELVEIELILGDAFATALQAVDTNSGWQGPLRSDFGVHLVLVAERIESRQPAFEEIRPQVVTALVAQRRSEANQVEFQKLRDRYEIVIAAPGSETESVETEE
ncbi:MAG: peptidyl-prolyl cis-trans isomerase [Candidatus Rariloculaceae bacterium]